MRSLIRNIGQFVTGWFRPRNLKPVKKNHNPHKAPSVKIVAKGNTHPNTKKASPKHIRCWDMTSGKRSAGRKKTPAGRTRRIKPLRYGGSD